MTIDEGQRCLVCVFRLFLISYTRTWSWRARSKGYVLYVYYIGKLSLQLKFKSSIKAPTKGYIMWRKPSLRSSMLCSTLVERITPARLLGVILFSRGVHILYCNQELRDTLCWFIVQQHRTSKTAAYFTLLPTVSIASIFLRWCCSWRKTEDLQTLRIYYNNACANTNLSIACGALERCWLAKMQYMNQRLACVWKLFNLMLLKGLTEAFVVSVGCNNYHVHWAICKKFTKIIILFNR